MSGIIRPPFLWGADMDEEGAALPTKDRVIKNLLIFFGWMVGIGVVDVIGGYLLLGSPQPNGWRTFIGLSIASALVTTGYAWPPHALAVRGFLMSILSPIAARWRFFGALAIICLWAIPMFEIRSLQTGFDAYV